MFCNTVSPSKLSTFRQCRLKFKYRYNDKLYVSSPNQNSLNFGSYIHKILEDGYQADHISELEKLADKHRQTYRVTSKDNKRTQKCLDNFLKFNVKLEETLGTELKFEVELVEGISLNGIIDRVIAGDKGGILVIDYKTSKREKTRMELFKDPQLMGYAFAVHTLYNVPYSDITCSHYYPVSNNFVTIKYSKAQINTYINSVVGDVWKIRKAKLDDLKRPSQNQFCNWCEYKKACPQFIKDPLLLEQGYCELKEEAKKLNEAKKAKEEVKKPKDS